MSLSITSRQNPKIQQVIKLSKHSVREETQLFIVEGYRELSRAVAAGYPIFQVFICPEFFLGENEGALLAQIKAPIYTCQSSVFQAMSYRDRPDGILAVAKMQHQSLDSLKSSNPFYVVAEAIEKPGNLGTILRSADGAGADGVIVADACTDLFNPNVVRSSVGTLFTQPVVEAKGDVIFDWLKANQIAIVAATPSAKAVYTDVDLKGPVAILVGTEQYGLSERWMNHCDIQVKIPMKGVADSLNVAMATTLLLYEVARQRRV